MTPDVDDLPFVQARVPFVAVRSGSYVELKRSRDRTTAVVRQWLDVRSQVQASRAATLEACEAKPGKGGAVTLAIADQALFDRYQEKIGQLSEELASLESAICRLDELERSAGPEALYFDDLESEVQMYGPVESKEKARIAGLTAEFVRRNPRMTPEEVMGLPEYLKIRGEMERTIKDAAGKLEILRPRLQSMTALLESVGC